MKTSEWQEWTSLEVKVKSQNLKEPMRDNFCIQKQMTFSSSALI